MSDLEAHYAAADIEARLLDGLRAAGLDPDQRLSPAQLAPLDHFHTGGLGASHALLDMAGITATDRVLDIGAGLAGCARLLVDQTGCSVDCVEMSGDYCVGANLLNRLTGLQDRIRVEQGSALQLPYPDASFDVVWMQNVGMNIEDKPTLYREIARVLKPGGRFAFQEVAAGQQETSYYPLPWASVPAHNFLISSEAMQALLEEVGMRLTQFIDVSESQPAQNSASSTPASEGQLGLGVFVDNLAEKAANARRSLDENQIRYVRAVYTAG